MDQAQLLQYLVETFEALSIPYMIGGSQASIYYGEPRFTQDIDVVADVNLAHVAGLVAKFPMPEFYLSEDAIAEALRLRTQFNIIHPTSGLKIDVIVLRDTPYDRVQFARRQPLPLLPGVTAYFARPEDVILYKLIYYREGGSEKHLRDIASMLAVSHDTIDQEYIAQWAPRLGCRAEWEAVCRKVATSS